MMEPHLFRVAPGARIDASHSHEGEEFLYLVRGRLHIELEARTSSLRGGDRHSGIRPVPATARGIGSRGQSCLTFVRHCFEWFPDARQLKLTIRSYHPTDEPNDQTNHNYRSHQS
jgi:hypothetical protein